MKPWNKLMFIFVPKNDLNKDSNGNTQNNGLNFYFFFRSKSIII